MEYWRDQAKGSRLQLSKAAKELDRLRAELAEAEDAYDSLSETDTELIGEQRKRIEELESLYADAKDLLDTASGDG